MPFHLPPIRHNFQGQTRRVGFELEFAGLNLEGAAAVLLDLFGGRLHRRNKFLYEIEESRYGSFTIELDASILKTRGYRSYLDKFGIRLDELSFGPEMEEILARIASTVVPYEIVSPPIPLPELQAIENLKTALRERKALGTRASLLYAFGLHINPEAPSLEAADILCCIRAFLLLYAWIHLKSKIDFSRRLTPFIHEFPREYTVMVLDPDYGPDLPQLIDHYLDYNPTRNRPLDFLPLLAFIDRERVLARAAEKNLIKPRPAYHYRLPNCLLDEPGWTIAQEWNTWVEVEKLAADPAKIRDMSADLLRTMTDPLGFLQESWPARVEKWLAHDTANL